GMDEDEQTRYVSQLREVFDSCDTTGTGYLDKEELAELCRKLHLEPHLPVLLNTLLGPDHYARVNFEEFKEGFVAVLSHSLELSTSEDESSYLEPVVPEEVKPKFVKGAKRYGRRSRPEGPDSEAEITADCAETLPFRAAKADPFPVAGRRLQLRRSTSLESVETHSRPHPRCLAALGRRSKGSLSWHRFAGRAVNALSNFPPHSRSYKYKGLLPAPGVVIYLKCLILKPWQLFHLLPSSDSPGCQAVTGSGISVVPSEPCRPGSCQLKKWKPDVSSSPRQTDSPQQDVTDGQMLAIWEELGVGVSGYLNRQELSVVCENIGLQDLRTKVQYNHIYKRKTMTVSLKSSVSQSLFMVSKNNNTENTGWSTMLDFPLDEKLSLAELTLALDNELLVSGNGLHQAALVSYKTEIQFLHVQAEQACKERDKFRADLERAEKRNVQLAREVDDRHAAMETLNESKIKDIEQEYRDKLAAMRSEAEGETERLLQQAGQHRTRLEEELESVRAQGVGLREDVSATVQENIHLEKELSELRRKLSESERTVSKLQRDLDHLLIDKFGSFDSLGTGLLSEEERFSQIIKEYELQCRELRDRNDELNTELEMLRGSRPDRKSHQTQDSRAGQSRTGVRPLPADSDSGLGSLQNDPPDMSIETELAMQQLKDNHQQEVQDLKIQLETKVNFYERNIELMKRNMEVERKDIGEGFKLEISELEEQKGQLEERCERLQAAVAALKAQLQNASLGPEQEKRLLRERAELEQNYAKEISNLVQRLSAEKDQLEEELTSQRELEVQQIRKEAVDEVEQRLSQIKSQHAETQRTLSHQLYCEKSCLQSLRQQYEQDQRMWRAREQDLHLESRKDRLRTEELMSEEQARICNSFALEKKRLEDRHLEQVKLLHSEIQELKTHVAELKEKETLLENCTKSLEAQAALVQRLTADLRTREEELERVTKTVDELQTQQEDKLIYVQVKLESELKEKETVLEGYTSAQEDELRVLRRRRRHGKGELLLQSDDLKSEAEDKGRLVEGLNRQSIAREPLQAQLLDVDGLKRKEQDLQDELEQEGASLLSIQAKLEAELDKVNSENSALKDQLSALQEHVQKLNVDLNRKTKELEQVMSEMEKKQSDVELVYKENARYRAEVLEMSNRNLQLSSENAELNSHIKADQGAIQLLNERLAEVSLQKGEEAALTRQLQEASARLQREQLQQEASWQRERELKDQELHLAKEQVEDKLDGVSSELTSLALKHQWLGQDKDRLEKEAEERNQKIEELQASLQALSNQVDQLHSQLLAANRDRGLLTEEAAANQKRLEESMEKVEAMQSREAELRHVTQECQALRSRQVQLESDLQDSRDQLLEARTSLTLAQSRHARELEQLRERADAALPREQAQSLQGQLAEERHRGQELQEQLQAQAQQAGMQMSLQQEQYENVLKRMEEKMEDVEAKLRNLRVMLQEKVDQLKEQLSKNAKSDVLLKDLYVENSQLMKALQVTEQRQKSVEKKNFALEEKIAALNKLLRKIAPATLTA
ncbi:NINL protein, partial [Amia calva]|nr:NINL protein [Amia calva]